MNSKEVQTCNLINTAANPNSDGVFVTVMQQQLYDGCLPRAKRLNIFSFRLCFCKWDFYLLTKSWQNDPMVLRISQRRSRSDRCWSQDKSKVLRCIPGTVGGDLKISSGRNHLTVPAALHNTNHSRPWTRGPSEECRSRSRAWICCSTDSKRTWGGQSQ